MSLYGGMVDLPLVVTRPEEERPFDPDERVSVTDDRLWAELDAEVSGVGKMERELREDLLGDEAWLALDPAARMFIASAEKIFPDQRTDPAFDFGLVVANLAKALEVTCNAILRRVGPRLPRELRTITVEHQPIDIGDGKHLSVGQMAQVLRGKTALHRALRRRLEHGDWFVEQLPRLLGDVAEVRNPGVHRTRVNRERATALRNRLVGVGCEGVFVELTRVRVK